MRRRLFAMALSLVMVLSLMPASAIAAETESPGQPQEETTVENAVYVSESGSDTNGNGTMGSPYATLTYAVGEAETGATIYVMSNLTMTTCARYYNKNLTITSYDNPNTNDVETYTLTREENFDKQQDSARSTYNPAMIEVGGRSKNSASLRLENIVLDDMGRHVMALDGDKPLAGSGGYFVQAASTGDGQTEFVLSAIKDRVAYTHSVTYLNTNIVHDAMIATYNGTATITLGKGTTLQNFGGMSAVRLSDGDLIMKDGSKICDTMDLVRRKADLLNGVNLIDSSGGSKSFNNVAQDYGPAGAVWIQGGEFVMEKGSEISNLNGRAVYVDGGTAAINGTIQNITSNNQMWQGTSGVAIHLRNEAIGTLSGTIEKCQGQGSVVQLVGATFTMANGSVLKNSTTLNGIGCTSGSDSKYNTINMDGEITGFGSQSSYVSPIQANSATLNIGKSGYIHDNYSNYGAIYAQGKVELNLYGKIENNENKQHGGGIATPGHGHVLIKMYDGSTIKNNSSGENGGGVQLKNCTFYMYGGEISNNYTRTQNSTYPGGGIYLRENSQFIMTGGKITDNRSTGIGGGIAFAANGTTQIPYARLEGGTISGNTAGDGKGNDLAITNTHYGHIDRYLYISDDMTIGDKAVYFQADSKTITPAEDSLDLKLGNASSGNTGSVSALTAAATEKGWGNPLATFWAQRDGAAELTVGGLNLAAHPVYVLTQKTNDEGTPAQEAEVKIYAATKKDDGTVSFALPTNDVNENGCAVALVQPTADYGTLSISGPAEIKENPDATAPYSVNYTVTYTLSDNLKSIINQAGGNATYTLTLSPDSKLRGNVNTSAFNGGPITANYTLPADTNFKMNKDLSTSALLTITVNGTDYIVPSNVAQTKLIGAVTVTFDLNGGGGTAPSSVKLVQGTALGSNYPAAPTRSDYTFTGWNTQADGKGTSFTKDTIVNADVTLYAQWNKVQTGGGGGHTTYYTLQYESNGGTEYKDERHSSGSTVKLDKAPIREGYDFTGWYADKGTTEKISSIKMSSDKTVYAGWRFHGPLNAEDHVAYVHGYPDGTVGPNRNITRAETAVMLYRLLTSERSAEITTTSSSFRDVTASLWYNKEVSSMANGGYVTGYEDGTFGGDRSITRAEFVTMMVRFIGPAEGINQFTDVPNTHWAYKYISTATAAGWIAGYTDGSFAPEKPITRAEAMTIINRVLNRGVDQDSEILNFKVWPDNQPGDWFYYDVIEATNSHEYTGSRPSEDWTKLILP